MTEPTSGSMPTLIAARFLYGLRVAVVTVTGIVLIAWQLPTVLQYASRYRPPWLQFVTLAVVCGLLALAAVVAVRDRPWGRLRWPMLAIALASCVISTAGLAPADLVGLPHWSWETFGWFAVILLMDLPIVWFASTVVLFLSITLAQVLLAGQTDRRILVGMATGAFLLGAWQFATALAAGELRRRAVSASRIAAEEEALRTAELVAQQLHRDRQSRYGELVDTAVPLLTGLATGKLDPADPAVQHACVIEAARMRRLFAESDDVPDALEHELHACIDLAERRGVAVQLALRGSRPALPRAARRALTEPVIAVLAGAVATARITVVGVDGQVVVSVVADQGNGQLVSQETGAFGDTAALARDQGRVEVSLLTGTDGVWLDATWRAAA
jgi:hypothetical protein